MVEKHSEKEGSVLMGDLTSAQGLDSWTWLLRQQKVKRNN